MLALTVVFALLACFCIYNYWAQKEKYKRMLKDELSRQNKLNSPAAWMLYTVVSLLATFGMIGYYIYKMYVTILEMQ